MAFRLLFAIREQLTRTEINSWRGRRNELEVGVVHTWKVGFKIWQRMHTLSPIPKTWRNNNSLLILSIWNLQNQSIPQQSANNPNL